MTEDQLTRWFSDTLVHYRKVLDALHEVEKNRAAMEETQEKLEAKNARLIARCAALEKALKTGDDPCSTCQYYDTGYQEFPCNGCDDEVSCWEFDEARFASKTKS